MFFWFLLFFFNLCKYQHGNIRGNGVEYFHENCFGHISGIYCFCIRIVATLKMTLMYGEKRWVWLPFIEAEKSACHVDISQKFKSKLLLRNYDIFDGITILNIDKQACLTRCELFFGIEFFFKVDSIVIMKICIKKKKEMKMYSSELGLRFILVYDRSHICYCLLL